VSLIPASYPSLTALMITHHEWTKVEECLSSFRKYYPDGQILLARDVLTPYVPQNLKKFQPTLVSRYNTMEKILEFSWDDRDLVELKLEERMLIVEQNIYRLFETATLSHNEYILALEYDARVRGRVPVFSDTDIESLEVNPYPSEFLNQIKLLSNKEFPIKGWGFVVGTVSRTSLLRAHDWCQKNQDKLTELTESDPRMVVLDFLLPILVHISGGVVSNHGLTTECLRDKFWRFRRTPLLHQYESNLSRGKK
jgi:hypothetical protein